MSQIPPGASSGWLDPYGRHQPGTPPPGYWQANDGRWYPPNPAPATPPPGAANPAAQTQIANPIPSEPPSFGAQVPSEPPSAFTAPTPGPEPTQISPPGYSPPPNFAPPSPAPKKSRTALYVVLGVVAFLFVGCSALGVVALNRAGDSVEDALSDLTTLTTITGAADDVNDQLGDATTIPPTDDGGDEDTTATTERSLAGVTTSSPAGAGFGDAIGCTVEDDETILVEVVNSSDVTQSYFFTVAFFEGSDRLGDTVAFVNNLRPGERTIEESFIFDQEGSRCEVIDSDSFPIESDPSHVADVSDCSITGADSFGDVAAELSATNSASVTSDYTIQVAFIGSDGVRRGTGFANIEAVASGQTAPTDVFTLVDDEAGLTCDVVGVDRIDS